MLDLAGAGAGLEKEEPEDEDEDEFESLSGEAEEEEAWETSSEMEADVDEKDSAFESESDSDSVLVEGGLKPKMRLCSSCIMSNVSGSSCRYGPTGRWECSESELSNSESLESTSES